jgi:hypothetical protein
MNKKTKILSFFISLGLTTSVFGMEKLLNCFIKSCMKCLWIGNHSSEQKSESDKRKSMKRITKELEEFSNTHQKKKKEKEDQLSF